LIINIPHKDIKIRKTKKHEIIDINEKDIEKIKMAIRANWVHYMDALLVRDINRAMVIYLGSIHDCFLVDFLKTNNFIIVANASMNKKLDLKTN
jgi:hypothetical protein